MKKQILVASLLLAFAVGCDTPKNLVPPETAARTFAKDLGFTLKGVSCAGTDTDNDGYVTCTINVDDGDGRSHIESLQCAAYGADEWNSKYATGCKGTIAKATPGTTTQVTVVR